MEQSFPLQTPGHGQIPGRRGAQLIISLYYLLLCYRSVSFSKCFMWLRVVGDLELVPGTPCYCLIDFYLTFENCASRSCAADGSVPNAIIPPLIVFITFSSFMTMILRPLLKCVNAFVRFR